MNIYRQNQISADNKLNYRPEIDGLRALAVIPVVLYHAGIAGFTGGFVGVDVFFVISGFLITSIILRDLNTGTFSFMRFWERRARRILPALLTVVVFTFVVGLYYLTPFDIDRLGQSIFAQSVFASNVLFWMRTGYFGQDAEALPLLHTWSLSVEEQFYILFPVSFFLITKFALRLRWPVVLAVSAVSFVISVYTVSNSPDAAFYLLPSRAWELGAGALLAIWASKQRRYSPRGRAAEVATILGIALIAYPVFGFDDSTEFPGVAALFPVAGTAFIIWANTAKITLAGRALAWRPIVFVGLISYSLYLWHWPLFVFAAYPTGLAIEDLAISTKIIVIAISVALAYVSWLFIETPIRRRRLLATRGPLLAVSVSALLVVGGLGFTFSITAVANKVVDDEAARYTTTAYPRSERELDCSLAIGDHFNETDILNSLCQFGPEGDSIQFVLWGDSHAAALMPVLDLLATNYEVHGVHASMAACAPVRGLVIRNNPTCEEFNGVLFQDIVDQNVTNVILAGSWFRYGSAKVFDPPNLPQSKEGDIIVNHLGGTVRELLSAGIQVWLVRDVPRFEFDPPRRLYSNARRGVDNSDVGRPYAEIADLMEPLDRLFIDLNAEGARTIDLPAHLCDGVFCPVLRNEIQRWLRLFEQSGRSL